MSALVGTPIHAGSSAAATQTRPEASEGVVRHLYLKQGHAEPLLERDEVQAESGKGLIGDLSYGRTKRQVLLIEEEALNEFGLEPGIVRENVVTRGVRLAGLPAGTRLAVGGAVLEVTMDCAPCSYIESLRPGLQSAMDGRRGTLCRVVEGGAIQVGNAVSVHRDEPSSSSLESAAEITAA